MDPHESSSETRSLCVEFPSDEDASVATLDARESLPTLIGRYRVERSLGRGAFGRVYLAYDAQLDRRIAVKVPHAELVARPEDAEAYFREARTVANLDHPHIVPVYDVGGDEGHPFYVVLKYVEGTDLMSLLKTYRFGQGEAAGLIVSIAEALHYAHKRGLVHRDVKPGNILVGVDGTPYIVDFGLALRDDSVGTGPRYAGTPRYMSPEQARGEGHRVDGRSDIYSLGAVFYEMLTGKRTFAGESDANLMRLIASGEPKPLRQIDDSIPKELERICLKALSRRASERYLTALDMAADIQHFQEHGPPVSRSSARPGPSDACVAAADFDSAKNDSDSRAGQVVVPKGLRSFDSHDADYYLDLLPGARDRSGLPESVRFWKTRVEETNEDRTFAVGLLYGPSGCGKTSFVRAGLLPHLSTSVVAVYVEATPDETEMRLLRALRKAFPTLPADVSLKEAVAELRRGRNPDGRKVLIVLDQFEQWLHARRDCEDTELVHALRQCDGGGVQCIVMVRDDFWMAITRFLRDLEVQLLEGQNSASVDLFPPRHARKVLISFGRAFEALPPRGDELTKDQHAFLDQAVSGLAHEGKIVCVRLALFAEMMKTRAWTPAALRDVGGPTGVGVTFLEETFSSPTAPPQRRLHQRAARAALQALLPESGSDIKGQMKSHEELLAASGYSGRPKDFDELIRVLDSELRLITPTDPEGSDFDDAVSSSPASREGRYYQLTHDYLVSSLRQWLNRKKRETRTGRAELELAELAAHWSAQPEMRRLPSLWQWLRVRWYTSSTNWTDAQKKMMAAADRYQTLRGLVALSLVCAVALAGFAIREDALERARAAHSQALVERLLDAETAQVPAIVEEMKEYRSSIDPLLHAEVSKPGITERQRLHAALALLSVDANEADYLTARLLTAEPDEVPVIRDALLPYRARLLDELWSAVATSADEGDESLRLRAAAALAEFDPGSPNWEQFGSEIAEDLVSENPVHLGHWSEAFRPVKGKLRQPLRTIYRDPSPERAPERALATNLLAGYASDDPQFLADLLMDADTRQFATIFAKVAAVAELSAPAFLAEIERAERTPDAGPLDEIDVAPAKRVANAAIALFRLGRPAETWSLLSTRLDPSVRTYLIHRLSDLGVEPRLLIDRLREERDISARSALLLSLGEYPADQSNPVHADLVSEFKQVYLSEDDPGLHASAEWLLRSWGHAEWLRQTNEVLAKDVARTNRQIAEIRRSNRNGDGVAMRRWYVSGFGHPMIAISGLDEFRMGSGAKQWTKEKIEAPHGRRISRSFAVAAYPVTLDQYRRFDEDHPVPPLYERAPGLPAVNVDWFQAARYCNWLSEAEGIAQDQRCYEIVDDQVAMRPNYLALSGYRLPTEAEYEYAARGGTATTWCFGNDQDLLAKYAWYCDNAQEMTWPVGSLKPNDFGFFDLHGSVWAWCQNRMRSYPSTNKAAEDMEEVDLVLHPDDKFILRGGSFLIQPSFLRSAARNAVGPSECFFVNGFRIARSLPAEEAESDESTAGED